MTLCATDCFALLQGQNTPLILAAKKGQTDTVKELISSGATVDVADQVSAWYSVPSSCSVVYSSCAVLILIIELKMIKIGLNVFVFLPQL